ncbi:MAG TPA: thiamine-phosphate kinase [Anaerohalosphaeraceae bacterium]|jgi:thiamine-monophosphate kinase|nr:thiamine-phosphate kinase [Anaerohalosphaeraceae bacterium]HRT49277.1 thiamine-phosphate kinase [Anaerohalosphaeraceae bacterium]HRT85184.1 thiamine-phosphate kinase [Anaerohalosphaeraceae bacterium]
MTNREDEITQWFASQAEALPQVLIGIGDDMAQAAVGGDASVLVTTDMLLDGTHFDLAEAGAEAVGYKAMAASLSDCAAMASVPLCAFAAAALPRGFGAEGLKQIYLGLRRAGRMFDCALAGGDITSWQGAGRLAICVTMLSRPAEHCAPVRRNGARAGDVICVTGELGGAIAGRHLSFVPRVHEALEITRLARVNAMMDISDGLSTDLNRICVQSGVGARVEAAALPLSEAAGLSADPIVAALNDGEDFELLFTLAREEYEKLMRGWTGTTRITRVGEIIEGAGMTLVLPDGGMRALEPGGYDHL